jgi:hypothetical protein
MFQRNVLPSRLKSKPSSKAASRVSVLKMEAVRSSNRSVNLYQTAQCHIPEDAAAAYYCYCCKKLKVKKKVKLSL